MVIGAGEAEAGADELTITASGRPTTAAATLPNVRTCVERRRRVPNPEDNPCCTFLSLPGPRSGPLFAQVSRLLRTPISLWVYHVSACYACNDRSVRYGPSGHCNPFVTAADV